MKNPNSKDPTITLQRAIRIAERAVFAISVMLVLGTVSYLSIHAWT